MREKELEQLRIIVRQAKITSMPMDNNVQHTNNDEKWIRSFHNLQTFHSIKLRLPKVREEINNEPIGRWLANQRIRLKRGGLMQYRLEILNSSYPAWCGSFQDQRDYELRAKEDFLVNYALANGKTPLTRLEKLTSNEVLRYYKNGVYTAEELLKNTYNTAVGFRALEAIYSDCINRNYINLIREMYQINTAKQLMDTVRIQSIVSEINDILRENSRDIGVRTLVRYYGLFGRPPKTLRDLAKELGISHETVRIRVSNGMSVLTQNLASSV